uniref:Uncharacterized protein n=1 Tax=Streptomyces sp. NBC_00003 TaxID=2903608 RepID=A0AAU2V930_9ACTN
MATPKHMDQRDGDATMADPRTYPRSAVELAAFVDDYLYGCDPAAGCGVCAALARELAAARKADEHGKAYDAAAEIRNHPHQNPHQRSEKA